MRLPMNKHQRRITIICAGLGALMVLFAPFHVVIQGAQLHIGYFFLFAPPAGKGIMSADTLLMQFAGLALGWLALYLHFGDPDVWRKK